MYGIIVLRRRLVRRRRRHRGQATPRRLRRSDLLHLAHPRQFALQRVPLDCDAHAVGTGCAPVVARTASEAPAEQEARQAAEGAEDNRSDVRASIAVLRTIRIMVMTGVVRAVCCDT